MHLVAYVRPSVGLSVCAIDLLFEPLPVRVIFLIFCNRGVGGGVSCHIRLMKIF